MPPQEQLTGTITRIFYQSAEFTTGIIHCKDEKNTESTHRFKGKFLVEEGETVTMQGNWFNDAKYGWQFNASSLIYDQPIDCAGLANYLANTPMFKGIGKAKAAKIAQLFGANFDEIIKDTPELLVVNHILTAEQSMQLQEEWLKRSTLNALSTALSSYGLTHCQLQRIVDQFGTNSVSVLKSNPYLLCNIRGFGFSRADEIALKLGIAKDDTNRIKSCLLYILEQEEENGNCWVDRDKLVSMAKDKLYLDNTNAYEIINNACTSLCVDEFLVNCTGNNGNHVGIIDTYIKENYIDDTIDKYSQLQNNTTEGQRYYAQDMHDALNDAQLQALRNAISYRISTITGKAGTGKTYTIKSIIEEFAIQNKSVALCAPTGKASKRMFESTGKEASTIHRLLGYNPKLGWTYNEDNKLEYDVVIADECSMMDVDLAYRLFSAIDFESTILILVGDDSQLLPVGVGCPFHDILVRQKVAIAELTEIVRQAGELKVNSLKILDGKLANTSSDNTAALRPWYVMANLESAEDLKCRLLKFLQVDAPKLGLNIIDDILILSPQNKGDIGVKELNIAVQELVQESIYSNSIPEIGEKSRQRFYVGDKVIQTRNSYTLGIFNGETGIVEKIANGYDDNGKSVKYITIKMDDGKKITLAEHGEEIRDFTLAYVMSEWKSQGSQYHVVISIVHSSHSYSLNRNLLYTAVTRAQKSSIIMGNVKGIRKALADVDSAKRDTWLNIL